MSREYTRQISVIGNVPSHGPFIFFDDFEHLLKWIKGVGVGDSVFELDPTMAYRKSQSLYMKTRTTDALANDIIAAETYVYMTPPLKLNYAIHFRSPDLTKIKSITFYFILDDGFNLHNPTVLFEPNTPKWQYHNSANAPQDITGATYPLRNDTWNRLQLLADLNSDKYIKIIINSRAYDLSAFSIYHPETGTSLHMRIHIAIATIGATPCELYIDDFLLHEL